MVEWVHGFPDEPTGIYGELGEDGREKRKVEEYRDGRLGAAGPDGEYGGSFLAGEPWPRTMEIAADRQFRPVEISRKGFEKVWAQAVGAGPARLTRARRPR